MIGSEQKILQVCALADTNVVLFKGTGIALVGVLCLAGSRICVTGYDLSHITQNMISGPIQLNSLAIIMWSQHLLKGLITKSNQGVVFITFWRCL